MRKFKQTAAAILVSVIAATTVTMAPASAAAPLATVRVNDNNDLVVFPKQDDLLIQINQSAPGSYAVWVTPPEGGIEVHNVANVTRDVIVAFKTREDINVMVGDGTDTEIPRRLSLLSESAVGESNIVDVIGVSIGDDLIVRGALDVDVYDSTIDDNVFLTSDKALSYVGIAEESNVGGHLIARASGTGSFLLEVQESHVGRLTAIGHDGDDGVELLDSSLGAAPRVLLRGGDDYLGVARSDWTGPLRFAGGPGDDHLFAHELHSAGTFDVSLHGGDDLAVLPRLLPNGGAGSTLHGGSGVDTLIFEAKSPQANVFSFESVNEA